MPLPDLNLIRQRYKYACGYCAVTEVSSGGLLTVDHYQPLASGGSDDLENLVYACMRCNQYKHRFWPTPDEALRGFRVLHPLRMFCPTIINWISRRDDWNPSLSLGVFTSNSSA